MASLPEAMNPEDSVVPIRLQIHRGIAMTVHLASARTPLALAMLFALLAHSDAATGATFTVGTGGDHATIQAALDAASLAAGDDEIRVRSGTYPETIVFFCVADERVELSGGWDATFEIQTEDPALTVIDAADAGRPLYIDVTDATVVVRNLTLTRGAGISAAGVLLVSHGHAQISLTDCAINHSLASSVNGSYGGGGTLLAYDTSRLELARCAVHDNRVEGTAAQASGGGLDVNAINDAQIVLDTLNIFDNEAVGATAFSGGVSVSALGAGHVTFVDSSIEGNSLEGEQVESTSGVSLAQGQIEGTDARIEFRRNRVVGNIGGVNFLPYQVSAMAIGTGGIVIGDSLIADGVESAGLQLDRYNDATLDAVNVTAVGNVSLDLYSQGGGVTNSLAGTTSFFAGTVPAAENLFDVDPGYVDAANGDYHLALSSPAIGAGSSMPSGGLGPNDLDGKMRRIGMGVDLGAFEADDPVVYVDSFE